MNIARIETFFVRPRWLFVRVETDDGLVGWGEPIVEGRAEAVASVVEALADRLIGADATRIEDHWQVMTKGGFYRGGPVLSSAVAGIDQALWDLKGKALGVPVYELLGGAVRDTARVYTWIGGDSAQALAEDALRAKENGFDAVKCNASAQIGHIETAAQVHRVVDQFTELRAAVGDDFDFAIDFHGRFSTAMARRVLPLLEPLFPLFVEEAVLPEFSRDLGAVTAGTSIPLATGERLYSRWDYRDVLSTGIAVAQPDLSHAGGISEVRRIAAMAEAYDVALAPHCPLGPIALAASLQVDFASPNFLIQEQSLGIHYNRDNDLLDYLVDPAVFAFTDGYVERPTGPGLGIEIDEAAVRKAAEDPHRWRNEIWRLKDGSFAEW
ncbi:galactonate dehydratase [Glycomyces algeriensis]|uniref:Galactonate dehydratase n=1 Tax=Glycomyces algeriensis TaxID=256037 RepID=A0A9W6GAF3_9ACTN|nr:galactonate dehydratase [Glycomyces algeriensis]MDA1364570.1 galactonate dehydratase [Glycomyces algeriensis]MDR7350607.1 galactonate dehydratase [Glycomyces algeriensis]GLI43315.1 galactonate dehydratase [Glycomyces algeriensis]